MIRFSANLTMLFTEVDFPDRFEQTAKAGFKAVEYMFPYPWKKEDLAERLQRYGLQQVLFNLPAGDGERMIKRTFEPDFRVRLHQKDLNLALESARKMGLSLPNTATTQELFNAIAAGGGSDLDHSALVMALGKLANHTVA